MVLSLLMFSDMTSRIHSELVMMDEEGNKRFVSDRDIAVNEVEKSKRERKKKHLLELQNAEGSPVTQRDLNSDKVSIFLYIAISVS